MFLNQGGFDILGVPVPLPVVVIALAIAGFVVGVAWLRRITGNPEDGDEHWRFRK